MAQDAPAMTGAVKAKPAEDAARSTARFNTLCSFLLMLSFYHVYVAGADPSIQRVGATPRVAYAPATNGNVTLPEIELDLSSRPS